MFRAALYEASRSSPSRWRLDRAAIDTFTDTRADRIYLIAPGARPPDPRFAKWTTFFTTAFLS